MRNVVMSFIRGVGRLCVAGLLCLGVMLATFLPSITENGWFKVGYVLLVLICLLLVAVVATHAEKEPSAAKVELDGFQEDNPTKFMA